MNYEKIKQDFENWWNNKPDIKYYELPEYQEGIVIEGSKISEELKDYMVEFLASYEIPTFGDNRWLIECNIYEFFTDEDFKPDPIAVGESYNGTKIAFFNTLADFKNI